MKRLILIIALLATFVATNSFAQAHKVLVEEFTSSTCPPCAATDPLMQQFQSEYSDKIVVLKWHVNWPSPGNDPMYALFTGSVNRSTVYYSNPYAPQVYIDGTTDFGFTGAPADVTTMESDVDNSASVASPFTIDVSQQIVGDSIIANLTVKSVGTLPTATDLRLGVVIGERYLLYTGPNGLPAHDYVVRTAIPALVSSTGALGTSALYPAFTITQGGTNTYRYAAKINAAWNRSQLYTAAFIQSVGSKTVYQANWTVPNIGVTVDANSGFDLAPSGALGVTFKNNGAKDQNVSITYSAPDIPSNWKPKMTGADANGSVTIPANSSKTIQVGMDVNGSAIGSSNGAFFFSNGDGIGMGGVAAAYFGTDNTDALIDGGAGITNLIPQLTVLNQTGHIKAGIADRTQFMNYFNDWSTFKTIYIAAGDGVGIQVGTNEWQNLSDLLTNGGNVLFTGSRTIGIYQSSGVDSYNQYWRDNFHIDPTANTTSTWSKITGVAGDPISNNISATLATKSNYRQGLVAYDDGFQGIFSNEKKDTVGMKALTGTGKVVYLSFELESLAATDGLSLTSKIIDWFYGVASVKTSNNASAFKIANYPNPVTSSTKFNYSLTDRGLVSLAIYDVMGREISHLISNEMQDAGSYEADFDASHLSNGSYTYVLTNGSNKAVGTMTVTK